MTPDATPKLAAKKSIVDKRSVNKYAVAPGVISIATTKIIPTVCSEATVTSDNNNINI